MINQQEVPETRNKYLQIQDVANRPNSSNSQRSHSQTKNYTSNFDSNCEFLWNRDDFKICLVLIFQFLDLRSVTFCSRVCKLWSILTKNELVWKSIYQTYFGIQKAKNEVCWKSEFKKHFQQHKQIGVYGGNLARSFLFWSEDPLHQFVPPLICETKPFQDVDGGIGFIYHDIIITGNNSPAAYDLLTSTLLWKYQADSDWDAIAADDMHVYLLLYRSLAALNLRTGKEIWKYDFQDRAFELLLRENEVIFTNSDKHLVALDKNTGNVNYVIKTQVRNGYCTLIEYGNYFHWATDLLLFVAHTKTKELFTIDWSVTELLDPQPWEVFTDFVMDDNRLYLMKVDDSNSCATVVALEINYQAQNAKRLWWYENSKGCYSCNTSPVVCRGIVWAAFTVSAYVVGLDGVTGEVKFSVRFEEADDSWRLHSNALYVIDFHLYYTMYNFASREFYVGAIDTLSGKLVWKTHWEESLNVLANKNSTQQTHQHIKYILGCSNQRFFMLWHQ